MDNLVDFPILSMREGDPVTVIGYHGRFRGTVISHLRGFCSYGGSWRVNVQLPDGTSKWFEYEGDRAHRFYR